MHCRKLNWIGRAHTHLHHTSRLSVVAQLAISIVFELGLNKPLSSSKLVMRTLNSHGAPMYGPSNPAPRTIEERRAVVSLFFITSLWVLQTLWRNGEKLIYCQDILLLSKDRCSPMDTIHGRMSSDSGNRERPTYRHNSCSSSEVATHLWESQWSKFGARPWGVTKYPFTLFPEDLPSTAGKFQKEYSRITSE